MLQLIATRSLPPSLLMSNVQYMISFVSLLINFKFDALTYFWYVPPDPLLNPPTIFCWLLKPIITMPKVVTDQQNNNETHHRSLYSLNHNVN